MISVTRLKGQPVALNPDMIESVEENPDTTIRLTSGEKLLVRESLAAGGRAGGQTTVAIS